MTLGFGLSTDSTVLIPVESCNLRLALTRSALLPGEPQPWLHKACSVGENGVHSMQAATLKCLPREPCAPDSPTQSTEDPKQETQISQHPLRWTESHILFPTYLLVVLFCFSVRQLWFSWEDDPIDEKPTVQAWELEFKSPEPMKSQVWKCFSLIPVLLW